MASGSALLKLHDVTIWLSGGQCFIGGGLKRVDLAIANGRIEAIADAPMGSERIDVTGLRVLPGLIDSQVRFREPGLGHLAQFDD